MRIALSNNHFSHDQQVADVLDHLREGDFKALVGAFPQLENPGIIWEPFTGSSQWDIERMGVGDEFSMHITDWIEDNTDIYWEDGEPWLNDGEEEGEDGDDVSS